MNTFLISIQNPPFLNIKSYQFKQVEKVYYPFNIMPL